MEDRDMMCERCGEQPHRWRPSPDAGPYWRCSVCGGVTAFDQRQRPKVYVAGGVIVTRDELRRELVRAMLTGDASVRAAAEAALAEMERNGWDDDEEGDGGREE